MAKPNTSKKIGKALTTRVYNAMNAENDRIVNAPPKKKAMLIGKGNLSLLL
jgi:hypothetical protein